MWRRGLQCVSFYPKGLINSILWLAGRFGLGLLRESLYKDMAIHPWHNASFRRRFLQDNKDQVKLRIGTRGSPLALAQAEDVKARLIQSHVDLSEDNVIIQVIKTTGDKILDQHLMNAGGKGLFTKEIEEALLNHDIDLAVHSSKDMPTKLPQGLELAIFLPREDSADAFISPKAANLAALPAGSTVGTASLRRRAQALRQRPDLNVITFRGNVQTRLKKLEAGEADATFLAMAGLNRLGQSSVATDILGEDMFLPAPAQGAVTVEIRNDDDILRQRLVPLHCKQTEQEVLSERAFLAALDGSCRTPIAGRARLLDGKLIFRGAIYSLDGQTVFEVQQTGDPDSAALIGEQAGRQLRAKAGSAFFDQLKADIEATIE